MGRSAVFGDVIGNGRCGSVIVLHRIKVLGILALPDTSRIEALVFEIF